MEAVEFQGQILEKLNKIEKELEEIKEHMLDLDEYLSCDDKKAVEDYKKEKIEGELISEEKLSKELF